MNREFQARYRVVRQSGPGDVIQPSYEILTVTLIAEGADQVAAELSGAGLQVLGVSEIRPIVDWAKPNFDRDEAAAFLGWDPNTLSRNKGSGDVPFSGVGKGLYPRAWLEQMILNAANPAGQRVFKQLEEAAA